MKPKPPVIRIRRPENSRQRLLGTPMCAEQTHRDPRASMPACGELEPIHAEGEEPRVPASGRLRRLGYEPYEMTTTGFSIRGLEHLRERFSKRAREVKALTEAFSVKKGRRATKREVEVLVRESRGKKLAEVTTPEVRVRQRAELTPDEAQRLDTLVRETMRQAPRLEVAVSQAQALRIVEAALRHVFERRSVAREGEVLSAALELHPEIRDWRPVRAALEAHPDVLRGNGEMTTTKHNVSLKGSGDISDSTVRQPFHCLLFTE